MMPRRSSIPPIALPEQIVSKPPDLAACLEHLAQAPVIAFDTEFVGEDSYRPDLCLVQAATAERLYVVDPFTCGPLEDFWRILLDPAKTIVVHAGREDVRLCHFAVGSAPPGLFDRVTKPGQPMPPPHSAAARPSSTIAGPSPARSR